MRMGTTSLSDPLWVYEITTLGKFIMMVIFERILLRWGKKLLLIFRWTQTTRCVFALSLGKRYAACFLYFVVECVLRRFYEKKVQRYPLGC